MTRAGRWALAGAALMLLSGAPAWAAELGRVQFQGKTVILSDDGTWRFDDTQARVTGSSADCTGGVEVDSKMLPISICFSNSDWERENPTGAWEFMFRNQDSTLYGGLIAEKIAMETSFLRDAILKNAAAFAKIDISQVKIGVEEEVAINGHTWNHIVYGVPVGGADFTFSNYYMTLPGAGMAQVVFFTPDTGFATALPTIESVVNSVRVSPAP